MADCATDGVLYAGMLQTGMLRWAAAWMSTTL